MKLGTVGRTALFGSIEDSYLLLGPPRSGKGAAALIPWIRDYPGPAVVTSTRDDLVRATASMRSERGPVWLFDPGRMVTDDGASTIHRAGWNLVSGCDDPLVAILRSRALVASGGSSNGVRHGDFWRGTSETVLRCFLHAAALKDRDAATVREWIARQDCADALSAIGMGYGADGWHAELSGIDDLNKETRSNVFAGAQLALTSLADPNVRALAGRENSINIDTLLKECGTVYIVGSPDTQHSIAPIVVAFIEAIVEKARRFAAANDHGRLDPPLGLFLDEAAQIAPLPSLPKLVSDGGGMGITPVVVLQSLAQARDRWGTHAADVIWDSSTVRMVFPGMANENDLQKISRLCGEVDDTVRSQYPSGPGTMTRKRSVMTAAEIRSLRRWRVLLLHKGMKPAVVRVAPHWKSKSTISAE